jgi:hypothetical protein
MTKKLAITVSGAVSLGSFEAGVMYEIIHAIGVHNSALSENDPGRIEIDVLTGASAGGMTATICAQKLMFEANSLAGAYSNSLFAPWVAKVNIMDLLQERPGDSRSKSILSSAFVEEISRNYITARYTSHLDPVQIKHAASANKIWLGLALANLNGVDYGQTILPNEKFIYTRFQDELIAEIDNVPKDDTFEYWDALRNAAVSCGAFPFAFKPVNVFRSPREYPSSNRETPILESETFCYTDGGTFQNEPLGLAKKLVDKLDPGHLDTANRYYLFVSPGDKKSVASTDFNADKADFIPFIMQLVSAIFNQGRFQDWIHAEKINAQIDLLNSRAKGLAIMLKEDTAEAKQLTKTLKEGSQNLLAALFGKTSGIQNEINENRTRLKILYADELSLLSEDARDVLIDSILTLEKAANLADKDEMKILGITAKDTELASSDMFAFAGFIDLRYRKHDYDVGRKKAQEFLLNPLCPLGRINFTPEKIDPIDESLNNMKLEGMPKNIREQMCDRFGERINETFQTAGLNGAIRFAVMNLVVKPRLRKFLKL